MNTLTRILKTPWLATIRSVHELVFAFVWLSLAIQIGQALPTHNAYISFGIALLIVAAAIAWKAVADTLWLARDARALCIPGVRRSADAVPAVAALLCILLPAAVLGLAFGHPALWLVSLALVAAGMLTLSLLPTVVALAALAAVFVYVMFIHRLPLPGEPGYLDWATPALAILTVVAAQRWIALQHATSIPESYWWRPTYAGSRVTALRRLRGNEGTFGAFSNWGAFGALGASARDREGASAALRNVGPDHPIRSLGVALHHTLVPFDARVDPGHYRLWRVALAAAVLAPPVLALLAERRLGTPAVLTFAPQFLLFAALALTAGAMRDRATDEAWCNPRGDLSLPALLPKLVRPQRAHRDTLIACSVGRLRIKLWCTYSCVMLFAVLHLPATFYVYLLLMLTTGAALQLATTTAGLAGRHRHTLIGYAMWVVVFLVAILPTALWGVRIADPLHPRLVTLGTPAVVCLALWLACCIAFTLLALANWRRFRRKPHPFL